METAQKQMRDTGFDIVPLASLPTPTSNKPASPPTVDVAIQK
jgi:hypothetical protein